MSESVRLDKWLWAARFFKTRNLAKQAIEGGKVQLDGQRCKVSRQLQIGDRLQIRQGWDEKEVDVLALSEQRRGAPEAQQLYCETEASINKREQSAAQRKAQGGQHLFGARPDKKQRRQIHRFKRRSNEHPED